MNTHKLSLPLYIHIPFCRFKCFYCDFNTYAGIENLLPDYVDALMIEIQRWGEALRQNGVESETPTVFFGGGTPSPAQTHTGCRRPWRNFQLLSRCETTPRSPWRLTRKALPGSLSETSWRSA